MVFFIFKVMDSTLKEHISNFLNEPIKSVHAVSGGDISTAYRIDTPNHSYFLKSNNSSNGLKMFQAEAHGLQLIHDTNTIKTPKVLAYDTFQNISFLLMEFIQSKAPSNDDFKNLGLKLAELHQVNNDTFGLELDNFIGSLNQINSPHISWVNFYTKERLIPQLELAKQKRLLSDNECPSAKRIEESLNLLFENIKPSLLHGDLWTGNYLISTDGTPYLIDPAIYYGHHEVDIAMTKLFGGFGTEFYMAYHSVFPEDFNTDTRIEIYQLYYLLVHLNLFGSSYYQSVKSILKKYF